jgi:hypothetical protein
MKRITCTLAALAMLIWTCTPAQAEFKGTLQGNQPWTLDVDNSNNALAAGLTIFYLGAKNVDFDIHTVPGTELLTFTDLKIPRGTRRIIIEVDPPGQGDIWFRVFQGGFVVVMHPDLARAGESFRLVFDVV